MAGDTRFGTAFIMLSREVELQDEIAQLLHDKELKTTVASMKADAKARFREVVDVVEDKEFWRKSKALVELCGPIMNLLRMADSDIPGTGKVYHENFKLGKILESMTDSAEFDFIPITVRSEIQSKWMSRWTDLHNPLHGAGYCLDPEFHSHDHAGCPEALTDFFIMCDKIHGAGSAESAKAQLDWQCFYKAKKGPMFSRETVWTNAAKMGPEEWYEMYVSPFHPELAMVGMRVLSQVISASSCERNWSAHGHIHSEVRNRLAPATTEKLVYIHSNRKASQNDELKMYTWDNE